ncbi:ndd1p [Saccharomyces arboricola H-6]|uniref:Ndd1p n=1 Tax=Saccharomyces arboricola (strain H-6 / AS 2.3317 / CBS 10644) TaxID=1160507 RepID=J8PYP0_SACAR|nr:ndd1p [Saccharomyces arboricola H-6]
MDRNTGYQQNYTAPRAAASSSKQLPTDNNADTNFLKVMSEFKYNFNSPLPTTTQFPTPYSSNQYQQTQDHFANTDAQNSSSNESSLVENSILPHHHQQVQQQQQPLGSLVPPAVTRTDTSETLDDVNVQPSSVLQFGTSLPGEFLVASPEQFKEFLLDSPSANFNFFHKTPAKTPLRFVTDSGSAQPSIEQNLNQQQNIFSNVDLNNLLRSSGKTPSSSYTGAFTRTPLSKIDMNLMFNQPLVTSPSKRFSSLSLTPYGRKILNDVGTPYAKALISSNSALVDFQKARKDISTNTAYLGSINSNNILQRTPLRSNSKKLFIKTPQDAIKGTSTLTKDNENKPDMYGSSPTTIQLNSSITKSISKLDNPRIPLLASRSDTILDSNVDDQLFDLGLTRLPLSPTPNCNSLHSSTTGTAALQIPELPKMGSFRSDTAATSTSNSNTISFKSKPGNNNVKGKIKKNGKKPSKFQIIVANIDQFNQDTSSSSLTSSLNTNPSTGNSNSNGTRKRANRLKRSQSLLSDSKSKSQAKKNCNSKSNGNLFNSQ